MPFEDAVFGTVRRYASVFLRLALGAAFLSGVADRFGLWGPAGTANVAWGDFQRFTAYTARVNPWAPAPTVPALAWAATVAEVVLGVALILGFFTRWSALLSGVLLFVFAFGMTVGTGLKLFRSSTPLSRCEMKLVTVLCSMLCSLALSWLAS